MVVYNTTFFIGRESYTGFLDWLRPLVETELCRAGGDNPRLSRLLEVPGEDPDPAGPMSVALQVEFHDILEARAWGERMLSPVVDRFLAEFSPAALSFSSIFETLPL